MSIVMNWCQTEIRGEMDPPHGALDGVYFYEWKFRGVWFEHSILISVTLIPGEAIPFGSCIKVQLQMNAANGPIIELSPLTHLNTISLAIDCAHLGNLKPQQSSLFYVGKVMKRGILVGILNESEAGKMLHFAAGAYLRHNMIVVPFKFNSLQSHFERLDETLCRQKLKRRFSV